MKIFIYVFGGVGLVLWLIAGFLIYNQQWFLSSAQKTTGTVIDLRHNGKTYYPVVKYTTQTGSEVVYYSNSGSNPPSYEAGETVEIFYNPNNPNEVSLPDFFSQWGGAAICGGIGSVFAAVGGGFGFFQWKRRKEIEWLQTYGLPVQAQYRGVRLNTSLTVNGRNPYRIQAQWLDTKTNTVYNFEGDDLWYDPSAFVNSQTLNVLIDPQNPKKHFIDTSFLPKQG